MSNQMSSDKNYPAQINDDELAAKLDPLSFEVLRRGATERPFTGEYTDSDKVGSYRCKACNHELFRSETKFHSGCGYILYNPYLVPSRLP